MLWLKWLTKRTDLNLRCFLKRIYPSTVGQSDDNFEVMQFVAEKQFEKAFHFTQ